MVKAGVGQHIKNETCGRSEQGKGDQAVDLPAKVQVDGGNASTSHQHQATNGEVGRQRRDLTAQFGQIDFQAGEKKKRRNAQGRKIGDHAVMNERREKAGHDDAKGKTSERRRQTEALQSPRNHQQAEDGCQVNKGRAWSLHSPSPGIARPGG